MNSIYVVTKRDSSDVTVCELFISTPQSPQVIHVAHLKIFFSSFEIFCFSRRVNDMSRHILREEMRQLLRQVDWSKIIVGTSHEHNAVIEGLCDSLNARINAIIEDKLYRNKFGAKEYEQLRHECESLKDQLHNQILENRNMSNHLETIKNMALNGDDLQPQRKEKRCSQPMTSDYLSSVPPQKRKIG